VSGVHGRHPDRRLPVGVELVSGRRVSKKKLLWGAAGYAVAVLLFMLGDALGVRPTLAEVVLVIVAFGAFQIVMAFGSRP